MRLSLPFLVGIFGTLAAADLEASDRFDLTKPSYDLFRHKSLAGARVQQSFSFDNVNRRLFVAQGRSGSDAESGDLTISQLDFSGKLIGSMDVLGFGHGVNIGTEPVGDSTYLWTEIDAKTTSGYGQNLTRFEFVDGTTLDASADDLERIVPIDGAKEFTCTIDPVYERLIVRYHTDRKRIAVFDMKDAADRDWSNPLADFAHPEMDTASDVFQGYTAYGQYLYLLYGAAYDSNGGVIDSEVATVDMNTGEVVQGPVITKAGSTLSYREPEGMAIYKTAGGEVRLFLGFASGVSGDRRSNIFYKNALV